MSRFLLRIVALSLSLAVTFDSSIAESFLTPQVRPSSNAAPLPIMNTQAFELPVPDFLYALGRKAKKYTFRTLSTAEGITVPIHAMADLPENSESKSGASWWQNLTAPSESTPAPIIDPRIKQIQELAGLYGWLPKLGDELDEHFIKTILAKEDDTPSDSEALALWIRNAQPINLEDFALYLTRLYLWSRHQNPSVDLDVGHKYPEESEQQVVLYLTQSLPTALSKLAELMESESHAPGLAELIQPSLEFIANSYATEFNRRFLSHAEVPLLSPPKPFYWRPALGDLVLLRWHRVPWKTVIYRGLRSDFGRIWFAPGLWILIGSLGGFTSAILCNYLARFVLRPFYDGLLNNLSNAVERGGAPLNYRDFAFGLSAVHDGMTIPELRLASSQFFALAAGQEGQSRLLLIYLLQQIIDRTAAFPQLKRTLPILQQALSNPENASYRGSWDAIVPIIESEYHTLQNDEAMYILTMLGLPLTRPPDPMPEIGSLWRQGEKVQALREIRSKVPEILRRVGRGTGRALIITVLASTRGFLRYWNLQQLDRTLFWLQNRCSIALGGTPRLARDETARSREQSHVFPWLAGNSDDQLRSELLEDLRGLNLPELEPFIQNLENKAHFLFRSYRDDQWYPRMLRWNRDDVPSNAGVSSLDLENNTFVLSRRMPPFVNMIILLRLGALLYRHEVILGREENIHLTDQTLVSVQHKALFRIGRLLFRQDRRFTAHDHQDRWLNIVHFMQILLHAWSGKIYSATRLPGILFMRQVALSLRPFAMAREGFVISSYYFMGRKIIAVTDQATYPIAGMGSRHLLRVVRLWQLLKPTWPILTQLTAALVATGIVSALFSGLVFDLNLDFLWRGFISFKDWLVSLQWFHIGAIIKAVWQSVVFAYHLAKELLLHFFAIIRVDWAHLQVWLRPLIQAFAPVKVFFMDTVIPFFYSFGMPALLFIVGMSGGYAIYRIGIRRKASRWGQKVANGVLMGTWTAIFSLVSLPASYFVEPTDLQNLNQKIRRKLEKSRFKTLLEKVLIGLVLFVYGAMEFLSILVYLYVLAGLASSNNVILEFIRIGQSQGTPVNVLMILTIASVVFGLAYANFFRFLDWVIRRLKRRSWDHYGPWVVGGMAAVIALTTLIFPTLARTTFRKDPFAFSKNRAAHSISRMFQRSKDEYIFNHLRADQAIAEAGWILPTRPPAPPPWDFKGYEEYSYGIRQHWDAEEQARHARYFGMEELIDPITGWPRLEVMKGEGRSRQLHDWLRVHKASILRGLEGRSTAIYGNSAFFEHLFTYTRDDDETLLLDTFTSDEWRMILNHLMDILEQPVSIRHYEADYVRKSLALFALDSFIWGDRTINVNGTWVGRPMAGIDLDPNLPVGLSLQEYIKHWTIAVGIDDAGKKSLLPSQLIRQTPERRRLMGEILGRLSRVRSRDNDIARHIANRVETYRILHLAELINTVSDDDLIAARREALESFKTERPTVGIPAILFLEQTPVNDKPLDPVELAYLITGGPVLNDEDYSIDEAVVRRLSWDIGKNDSPSRDRQRNRQALSLVIDQFAKTPGKATPEARSAMAVLNEARNGTSAVRPAPTPDKTPTATTPRQEDRQPRLLRRLIQKYLHKSQPLKPVYPKNVPKKDSRGIILLPVMATLSILSLLLWNPAASISAIGHALDLLWLLPWKDIFAFLLSLKASLFLVGFLPELFDNAEDRVREGLTIHDSGAPIPSPIESPSLAVLRAA